MKKELLIMGVVGMLALVFVYPADAGLILTFKKDGAAEPLQRGQVHYFLETESSGANLLGRTPGDYGSTFNMDNTAHAFDPIPSTRYEFWADAGYPNTAKALIRIWNNATKGDNSLYTGLQTRDVPSGSGAEGDYDIVYTYIKAAPAVAVIREYEDAGTVYIDPPSPDVRTVTFKSTAPQIESGGNYYTVEIKESIWEITKNSEPAITKTVSGKNLALSTGTGDDLSPGTQYTIKVKHRNYWDQENPSWSVPVTYVIGEGVGGAITVTYDFKKPATLGVNQFGIPMTPPVTASGGTSVGNISELVNAINTFAGSDVVNTIGWWDPDATPQVPEGYTIDYTGGITYYPSAGLPSDPTTIALDRDKVYQISVSTAITGFQLTGSR